MILWLRRSKQTLSIPAFFARSATARPTAAAAALLPPYLIWARNSVSRLLAGHDSRARLVVDHLCVNVLRAAKNRKPGPFGRPGKPVPHSPPAASAGESEQSRWWFAMFTARSSSPHGRLLEIRKVISSQRPCRPSGGQTCLRNGSPCPCMARADAPSGRPPRTGRPPACRRAADRHVSRINHLHSHPAGALEHNLVRVPDLKRDRIRFFSV